MRKIYLKADSMEYLEYLKKQKNVSRADIMIEPVKTEYGWYRGYLPNGYQETVSKYIWECNK